jgi:hypothetical protein
MISSKALAAVAALAVTAIAAAGWAQDKPAADKSNDAGSVAVPVLIGDAVAEYDAGRYEEARALFRLAHEKSPSARTLRGIGMASFEMRDYVEATRALAASLRDQRRPLTADQRKHAQALLARAETFVGQFSLKLSPTNLSLFIDGRPAVLEADGSLLLALGRHEISARCAACSPNEKQLPVDVAGGEKKHLELTLALASVPPATADTTGGAGGGGNVPTLVGGPTDAASEGSSKHLWFAGTAGVAAIAAGAGALWWRKSQHEVDECRSMVSGMMCTNEADLTTRRSVAIGTTIGLGVTAITTAVLAAIYWRSDESAPAATTSTVACFGGNNSVGCAFRF